MPVRLALRAWAPLPGARRSLSWVRRAAARQIGLRALRRSRRLAEANEEDEEDDDGPGPGPVQPEYRDVVDEMRRAGDALVNAPTPLWLALRAAFR